jgi:hypothetical protein
MTAWRIIRRIIKGPSPLCPVCGAGPREPCQPRPFHRMTPHEERPHKPLPHPAQLLLQLLIVTAPAAAGGAVAAGWALSALVSKLTGLT